MKPIALSFVAGTIFALGLGVSGMTNPEKVLGFLDVSGRWDPSLALVMVGAIAVHAIAATWARRAAKPLGAPGFHWPRASAVDLRLVSGALLFGLGWGIVGFCPGPALVDLAAPSRDLLLFVAAMLSGIAIVRLGKRGRREIEDGKRAYEPAGQKPASHARARLSSAK